MKVSIVIPTFNGEKHIRETVQSVVAQTYPNWEMLIADDGSTDGTVPLICSLAERDTRIRVVTGQNRGKVAVCNNFLQQATGEYVAILDHDDLYKPNKLEKQVAYLEAHPEVGMVYCGHDLIDGSGNFLTPSDPWILYPRYAVGPGGKRVEVDCQDRRIFPYLAVGNCIPMLTHLIRRSAAVEVGLLDPACWPSDDWDYWIRFSRIHEIAKLEETLASYRFHDSNYTLNWATMGRSRRVVSLKTQADPTLTDQERQQFAAGVRADMFARAESCRRWAKSAWREGDYVHAARYSVRALKTLTNPASRKAHG